MHIHPSNQRENVWTRMLVFDGTERTYCSTNIKSVDSDVKATNIKINLSVAFLKNQTTYNQPWSGKFKSSKKMKSSPPCIPISFSLVNLHNHLRSILIDKLGLNLAPSSKVYSNHVLYSIYYPCQSKLFRG